MDKQEELSAVSKTLAKWSRELRRGSQDVGIQSVSGLMEIVAVVASFTANGDYKMSLRLLRHVKWWMRNKNKVEFTEEDWVRKIRVQIDNLSGKEPPRKPDKRRKYVTEQEKKDRKNAYMRDYLHCKRRGRLVGMSPHEYAKSQGIVIGSGHRYRTTVPPPHDEELGSSRLSLVLPGDEKVETGDQ